MRCASTPKSPLDSRRWPAENRGFDILAATAAIAWEPFGYGFEVAPFIFELVPALPARDRPFAPRGDGRFLLKELRLTPSMSRYFSSSSVSSRISTSNMGSNKRLTSTKRCDESIPKWRLTSVANGNPGSANSLPAKDGDAIGQHAVAPAGPRRNIERGGRGRNGGGGRGVRALWQPLRVPVLDGFTPVAEFH